MLLVTFDAGVSVEQHMISHLIRPYDNYTLTSFFDFIDADLWKARWRRRKHATVHRVWVASVGQRFCYPHPAGPETALVMEAWRRGYDVQRGGQYLWFTKGQPT